MTFEEFLTEHGHYDAEKKVAEFKRIRAAYAPDWPAAYAAGKTGDYKTLAEYDEYIAKCEHATAVTYEQLVKQFDAENDLAFAALQLEEGLRLIVDEVEEANPGAGLKLEQLFRDMAADAPDKPKE